MVRIPVGQIKCFPARLSFESNSSDISRFVFFNGFPNSLIVRSMSGFCLVNKIF